ncbi:hypothetical protein GCM10027278_35560 [Paralcaligenes ginsengisoli]
MPGLTLAPIDGAFKYQNHKYQSYPPIESRKQLEPKNAPAFRCEKGRPRSIGWAPGSPLRHRDESVGVVL